VTTNIRRSDKCSRIGVTKEPQSVHKGGAISSLSFNCPRLKEKTRNMCFDSVRGPEVIMCCEGCALGKLWI
jgi:hypothetical protein